MAKVEVNILDPSAHRRRFWLAVPLIALGGMLYPVLGLLMVPMMAALLVLSMRKGRYWCANICPRGSFLDFIIRPFSGFGKGPSFLASDAFKHGFLALFFALFILRISIASFGSSGWILLERVGFVLASLCLITTIAAAALGLIYAPRTWCVFCPMGTLQTAIHKSCAKKR